MTIWRMEMKQEHNTKEKIRIRYYEDNMSRARHLAAYLVFAVAIGLILYIYYHQVIVSVLGGLVIAVFQEKITRNPYSGNG